MSSINHGATFKTKLTLSNLKGLLKKEKNPKENSFQDWLQIEKIENNSILFRDNRVIKILKVSPNYIFEDLYDNQDSQPSSLSSDMLIKYLKLSQDNKKFIDNIVDYIYNIQKCK